MLKDEMLKLINTFDLETSHYIENNNLDEDMQYIYSIEKEIKNSDESNLKSIYDKLKSIMGIIKFKYGYESIIINANPEFDSLKKTIDNISLNSNDIINQYNYILNMYNNIVSKIKNMNFIENEYINKNTGIATQGKEGLYLAVESLKSLISNDEYRQLLDGNQINEILIDCVRLNNGVASIVMLESKYKEIIKQIWQHSLSNKVNENENFKMLFSNISNDIDLSRQAYRLINRPDQSSCSMISSDFIATYQGETRRIGFIYPSDSYIIMVSAYDLCSRVFGEGSVNKEKGTTIATPQVLEKIGKERTAQQGEDLYSSSCYNEILVNAKPCGIVVIGLGENDLNIDYQEAKRLSLEMNLPIYYIDTMKYKDKLSDKDKYYIAFHSLLSYLGISREDLSQQIEQNNGYTEIYNLINIYKEQLAEVFLTLKREGNLSKDNMCQVMSNIVDVSKINGKSR